MFNIDINMEMKEDLYNYSFHYNYHIDSWACYNRKRGNEYFNGKYEYVGFGKGLSDAYEECKRKEKDKR